MINVFEALADVVRLAAMQVLLALEWLRERDPIHRMKLVDAWVLTRYAARP